MSGPRLLIRLEADGRSDQTFHPTEPPADPVEFAMLLPHGHVVLHAGSGVELKRYTSNGTLESSSNSLLPDSDGRGMVTAIQADSSGRIFVSGLFALAGRPGVYGLVRLQADGALDAKYPPVRVKSPLVIQEVRQGYNPTGTRLTIRQSDGRSRQWVVARAEIEPQPATDPDRVLTAWQAPDGKLLALQNRRLWRLKEDGLPDPAFVVAKLQTEP